VAIQAKSGVNLATLAKADLPANGVTVRLTSTKSS
jgi:hypothetical protein